MLNEEDSIAPGDVVKLRHKATKEVVAGRVVAVRIKTRTNEVVVDVEVAGKVVEMPMAAVRQMKGL